MTPTRNALSRIDLMHGALVSLACLIAYLGNGDISYNPDPLASCYTAVSILHDGDFAIDPREVPAFFEWRFVWNGQEAPINLNSWDDLLQQRMDEGALAVVGPKYFVFPAKQPGVYVNVFGPGTPCVALPLFYLWDLFVADLHGGEAVVWQAGKACSAMLAALSVGVVFCCARLMATTIHAIVVSFSYGLGTCIWSAASQNLWQHSPMDLFLAIATLALLYPSRRPSVAFLCGLCVGIATVCRPTGAFVALTYALYYLFHDRKRLIAYVIGGVPPALALAYYGYYFFGSPLVFGQSASVQAAVQATGTQDMWQTPLLLGLAGHLLSPSRGLFIFSPFLIFSLGGIFKVWKQPADSKLRWIGIAVFSIWIVQSKFFDWWGGYSFGYRHIVDSIPLFVLFLVPALNIVMRNGVLVGVFSILLAWSIFVQIIGVTLYDTFGWNGRRGYVLKDNEGQTELYTTRLDTYLTWKSQNENSASPKYLSIDDSEVRERLWSLTDHQLGYYLTHARESRATRASNTEKINASHAERLSNDHRSLAFAFACVGEDRIACLHITRSLVYASSLPANLIADAVLIDQSKSYIVDALVQRYPHAMRNLETASLLSASTTNLCRHLSWLSLDDPVQAEFDILDQIAYLHVLNVTDKSRSKIQPDRLYQALNFSQRLRRACLYLSIDDIDSAKREWEVAESIAHTPYPALLASLVHYRRAQWDDALRDVNSVLQEALLDSDLAIALLFRAQIFRAKGDMRSAQLDEKRAAPLRRSGPIPRWLADAYLDRSAGEGVYR